jgi:hypothetical protein
VQLQVNVADDVSDKVSIASIEACFVYIARNFVSQYLSSVRKAAIERLPERMLLL